RIAPARRSPPASSSVAKSLAPIAPAAGPPASAATSTNRAKAAPSARRLLSGAAPGGRTVRVPSSASRTTLGDRVDSEPPSAPLLWPCCGAPAALSHVQEPRTAARARAKETVRCLRALIGAHHRPGRGPRHGPESAYVDVAPVRRAINTTDWPTGGPPPGPISPATRSANRKVPMDRLIQRS
ncbi:MAG: hypothetical protein ACI8WY_000820, partial [Planctomycetota bacterium]